MVTLMTYSKGLNLSSSSAPTPSFSTPPASSKSGPRNSPVNPRPRSRGSTNPETTKPFNFPTPFTETDLNNTYFLLPVPPSIAAQQDQSQFSPLTTAKATMKEVLPYTLASLLHHEAVQTTPLNAMEEFASYAVFGDRLHEIQWYMDKTKPRGIFRLWRDRRDSLAWHTL
ncbi:hypothetical protein MMC14_000307 [Varicellaria rhodocarpa]|nr:hypothetical protein [Varicellaria rhodocarpa]